MRWMPASTSLPILTPRPEPRTCVAPKPRASRMGRWRMGMLLGVHVLFALHIWHWFSKGETFTAVEPSETVYMFTQGAVNIGAILFGVAILGTLIFGRFFCGWACHIIFVQDVCTALLKRLGFRPKPFRSRLLIFVPLGAALYMFAWPAFYRHVIAPAREQRVPPYEAHFTTEHLWDTFPGLGVSILSIAVCGFVIVYLLGNKGYCTYACPYGGFFGLADQFAPGKIRVTDDCEQCGHCTSVCTSNVRVHEEVKLYGMVVNPGCMKCLDCIDVCPKDALYVGFGRPTVAAGSPRAIGATRTYDFTWGEELLLACVFMGTLLILRGLYDAIPFLLALGISSISAFLMIYFKQSFTLDNLRLHRWQLRRVGKTTSAGWGYRAFCVAWLVFVAHSAFVQHQRTTGTQAVEAGRQLYSTSESLTAEARAAFERGRAALQTARTWGLYSSADQEQQLGSAYRYLGEQAAARKHFEKAVEIEPRKFVAPRFELAIMAGERKDLPEIERQLRGVVRHSPEFKNAAVQLAGLLSQSGRAGEAIELLKDCIRRRPKLGTLRIALAQLHAMGGKLDEARAVLAEGVKKSPDDANLNLQYAALLAQTNDIATATQVNREWLARRPESAESHLLAADLAQATGQPSEVGVFHREEAARIQRARAESGAAISETRGRQLLRRLRDVAAPSPASDSQPAAIPSDAREAKYLRLLLEEALGSEAAANTLRAELAKGRE